MRILVTGSRDWHDALTLTDALGELFCGQPGPHTLVHGAAKGADTMAAGLAYASGVIVEPHPANWEADGKAAGPIRNSRMIELGADVCIAFPGPDSVGTWDCIRKAVRAGIPVRIYPSKERP